VAGTVSADGGGRDGGWDGGGSDGGPARRAAEEAVRLLQTLTEVTGSHDSPECRVCPICQLLAALRQVRPEAVENLIDAAARFTVALRDLTVPAAAATAGEASGPASAGATGATSGEAEPGVQPGAAGTWSGHDPGAGTGAPERSRVQRIEVTD
jgi:hypothetical protein